jgi:hypothetical protein
MTQPDITKLTEKYSHREIMTALKILVDILAIQDKNTFKPLVPEEEFTPQQIERLQKHLAVHTKNKAQYISLNALTDALGM